MAKGRVTAKKTSILLSAFDLARLERKTLPSLTVSLCLAYVAWLVMTPYTNFPFLTDIRFERILVAVLWLAIIFTGQLRNPFDRYGVVLSLLVIVMYLSNMSTPYADFSSVRQWEEDYWKIALLFFALQMSISSRTDLKWFVAGLSGIIIAYQAYSLLDFFAGGSYVWQQGLRRAVGTWSNRSIGAANAFGFLGAFSLAFAIHWLKQSTDKRQRVLALSTVCISLLAVSLSGTRGAMVVSVVLLMFVYRKLVFRPMILTTMVAVLVFGFALLPQDLQDRYLSILPSDSVEEPANKVAERSAQSRIEGLKDGVALFANRPTLGYGPGASAIARLEVSTFVVRPLQLHSLYGQVLSELGIVGTTLFSTLLLFGAVSARSRNHAHEDSTFLHEAIRHKQLVGYVLIVLFVYGAVSHNLYSYSWIFAFALAAAVGRIYPTTQPGRKGRRRQVHQTATSFVGGPDN